MHKSLFALILACTVLIIPTVNSIAYTPTQNYHCNTLQTTNSSQVSTNTDDDILDQSQIHCDTTIPFGSIPYEIQLNQSIAQSFIPQTQVLTRIQIYLARNSTTLFPCNITIIKNLTDAPIFSISIPAENISLYDNLTWIEINLPDIQITQNTVYHFILSSTNITGNIYFCGSNSSDIYKNGSAYIKYGENTDWEKMAAFDLGFQIYGKYLPDLEIGFVGPFGLTICFTNYGLGDAHNLLYDIIIKGGYYNLIDIHEHGAYGTIKAGEEKSVEIPLFGLGWVNITVRLNDLIIKQQAIVIFFLVL